MPPVPQAPFVKGDMTNAKMRAALMNLTQLMAAQDSVFNNHFIFQDYQGGGPQPHASIPTSRILNVMRMNPPSFRGTKVYKDTQSFIDVMFKFVDAIGVPTRDKSEVDDYKHKDVYRVWF